MTGAVSEEVYGLGSCDMKAGIAVMLSMAELTANNREGARNSQTCVSAGRRSVFRGGLGADKKGVSADFCLMPEPTLTRL